MGFEPGGPPVPLSGAGDGVRPASEVLRDAGVHETVLRPHPGAAAVERSRQPAPAQGLSGRLPAPARLSQEVAGRPLRGLREPGIGAQARPGQVRAGGALPPEPASIGRLRPPPQHQPHRCQSRRQPYPWPRGRPPRGLRLVLAGHWEQASNQQRPRPEHHALVQEIVEQRHDGYSRHGHEACPPLLEPLPAQLPIPHTDRRRSQGSADDPRPHRQPEDRRFRAADDVLVNGDGLRGGPAAPHPWRPRASPAPRRTRGERP